MEDSQSQQQDESIIDRLSEEEKAWRKSLEVGSKLDAIKVETESNIKMWTKGEIIEINGNFLHIQFENDLRF